jgi:lipoate-protein ligase A
MDRFTAPVVKALQGLGLRAEASGRNDILVEGRKVSGTAQRISGSRILHHGTLLFDSNPAMVAGALNVDPAKFQSKAAKSVRSRIGNIREFLKTDMDMAAFWNYLKTALADSGVTAGSLTAEELTAVEELKRTKYDTWAWNYGRSPQYDFSNKCYYAGGGLEVRAAVKEGRITAVTFFGDFLAVTSLEELTAALVGCAFRREEVGRVLDRFPLERLFGAITREEVLDTMFHAGDAPSGPLS